MGLISRVSSRTYRISELKMKLLTHNFMQSIVKGVSKPYPLKIDCKNYENVEIEFSEIAVQRMLEKIDYGALLSALTDLKYSHSLPSELPETPDLKQLHHVLFEIEVLDGNLVCPESGREYPIMRGIPNMLLTEEEV